MKLCAHFVALRLTQFFVFKWGGKPSKGKWKHCWCSGLCRLVTKF